MNIIKSIVISFTVLIVGTCKAQQEIDTSLLVGKWYFCEAPVRPDDIISKLLWRASSKCNPEHEEFYWELLSDGGLKLIDTLQSPNSTAIDGVTVTYPPETGWKIESGFLVIANRKFAVDVLDERCHRNIPTKRRKNHLLFDRTSGW